MIGDCERVRVAHVDDDPLAANGLRSLLERTSGHAIEWIDTSAHDVLPSWAAGSFDLVVLDLYFCGGGPDGIDLAVSLRSRHPDAPVAILTSSDSAHDAARAWEAGVAGFLSKRQLLARPAAIAVTIDEIRRGSAVYHIDPRPGAGAIWATVLSSRETEILRRKVEGRSHREIAAELFISARTIDAHLGNVRKKLRAGSIDEAVRLATERGLVPTSDAPVSA